MTAPADLLALAGRLDAATGPDLFLDVELWARLGSAEPRDTQWSDALPVDPNARSNGMTMWEAIEMGVPPGRIAEMWKVPTSTASLDAAVALVEQTLPDAVWHIMTDYGGLNRAKIGPTGRSSASVYNCEERPFFEQADAETPPLALCLALVRALAQRGARP